MNDTCTCPNSWNSGWGLWNARSPSPCAAEAGRWGFKVSLATQKLPAQNGSHRALSENNNSNFCQHQGLNPGPQACQTGALHGSYA